MDHLRLVKEAVDAIGEVFGDTSVDRETTRESLQSLQDEIDLLLETLEQ